MGFPSFFFLLCAFTSTISASFAAANTKSSSAYEVLQQHGFPAGLLPRGITGYDLDPSTGKFSVQLNGTCEFVIENSYQLQYEPTIRGVISREKIEGLSGVSVKVVLVRLNIVEVVRDGATLEFSVGIGSKGFPVENFEECPRCGCGLDCKDGGGMELENGSSSSSWSHAI